MKKELKTLEILAPVGGQEQLIAAVRSGANAVYLGARGFNARRNAANFDAEEQLPAAVSYCHARGVRVHVTLNTLLTDEELPAAQAELAAIAAAGADAIIVQDLAVAKLVRSCCPQIQLHASTQMAVHNAAGVRALEKLGFCRVVLARELCAEEIKSIADSTDMEIEVFVHGALCMCASGLCELSAMIGGRSGNRGLCAQPCRLDFNCKGREYALSLKDMSHITALPQLAAAGVSSVKIEGRMKRPEYVAAAVTACRAALAGEEVDLQSLAAVFSRSGFTDGYLRARRTLDMFGYRTKEDVAAAAPVLKKLTGLYKSERPSVAADMKLTLRACRPASLAVTAGGIRSEQTGDIPQAAVTQAVDETAARRCLERTGGTQFFLRELTCELGGGLIVSASELNRLRRDALADIAARLEAPSPKSFTPPPAERRAAHEPRDSALRLRFETAAQLFDAPEAEKIILPAKEILKRPELVEKLAGRLVAELPALSYPDREQSAAERLQKLYAFGVREVLAENIGDVVSAGEAGFTVRGGASLNILNSSALDCLAGLGLADATVSIETAMGALRHMDGATPRGIIAYGYLPLMKFRVCPAQGKNGCVGCGGVTPMTDRTGRSFTVICRERSYSELLNCVPLYIGDKAVSGADFQTLYFTTESAAECRRIAGLFAAHAAPDFERTSGLYYRKVL